MKGKELKALSIPELRRLAKSLNVSITRRMTKDQIVSAVVASARSRAISATLKKKRRRTAEKGPIAPGMPGIQAAVQEERLPLYSGITKLVLMPRDPWWVFAYWEIDPAALGGRALILRVYRKKDRLYASIDVDGANNWYIDFPEPGETVRGEIGYMGPKGRFRVMAASNTVRTPRAWPSAEAAERPLGKKAPAARPSPFDEAYAAYERFGTFSRREITSRKQ